MKLKLDENGNAVLKDGQPVYTKEDGSEMSYDIVGIVKRSEALEAEKERHWKKAKEATEKLSLYEGLDPEAARAALEIVGKLDAKKLVDAGKIDELTADLTKNFQKEREGWEKEKRKVQTDSEKLKISKESTIRHLLITQEFQRSPHFTGAKPKTTLPADIAAEFFGKHFTVEGDGPEVKVVAQIGERRLRSKTDYAKDASFEEAITEIIEQTYPNKDAIFATSKTAGPRAHGNFNSNIDPKDRTSTQKIAAGLEKMGGV